MDNPLYHFLWVHTTAAALLSSGVIFYDGCRSIYKGQHSVSRQWQGLAVAVLAIYGGITLCYRWWLDALIVACSLGIEIRLMVFTSKRKPTSS